MKVPANTRYGLQSTGAGHPNRGRKRPASRVRPAGVADIAGIARLATATRGRADEPHRVSRARRLLLTHVAFEHGALWVEHDPDGTLTRSAAAIPGSPRSLSPPVLGGILRLFDDPVVSGSELALGHDIRSAIESAAPTWILAQIASDGHPYEPEDTALLAAAVAWAVGDSPLAPMAVLADSPEQRAQAERLDFTDGRVSQSGADLWLGVTTPPGP